jgi:hypothetical protein
VLNNINQFYSLRKLSVTVVGLLLTFGIVSEQIKPVFSKHIKNVPTSSALIEANQDSSETTLLTRLRQIRGQRNERWAAESGDYTEAAPQTTAPSSNQKSAKETLTAPKTNFPRQDGVYLYGQSPQPNQIGQGYIVFEKRQGRVNGALYMPSSEFSCFQGTLDKSGGLAMTVKALPDAGAIAEVATSNRLPRNSIDVPSSYAYSVALQDYHQIKSVSANDRRILQMCN